MILPERRRILGIAVCAVLFGADRLTKWLAVKFLAPVFSVPVTKFFYLTYAENTGAAFSMLSGRNWVFIPVAAALVGALYFWRGYLAQHGPAAVAGAALIAVGALGNLWDRVAYGYVVDFLDFRVWPIFNLADSYISVGGVLLGWAFYFRSPDAKKTANPDAAPEDS